MHIGLIGYGEHLSHPQHYTSNGNLNIEGDVKNIKFEETDPIITLEVIKCNTILSWNNTDSALRASRCTKLLACSQEAKKGDPMKLFQFIGQRLDLELGTFELTEAYEEAINYAFRPGAVKAVVGILATPCEKSALPLSVRLPIHV